MRSFLLSAALVAICGLALLLAGAFVAACGGGSTPQPSPSESAAFRKVEAAVDKCAVRYGGPHGSGLTPLESRPVLTGIKAEMSALHHHKAMPKGVLTCVIPGPGPSAAAAACMEQRVKAHWLLTHSGRRQAAHAIAGCLQAEMR